MTRTDIQLITEYMHKNIDKVEITEDEIKRMHDIVRLMSGCLNNVWTDIDAIGNTVRKEMSGNDMVMACVVNLLLNSFGEKPRFVIPVDSDLDKATQATLNMATK